MIGQGLDGFIASYRFHYKEHSDSQKKELTTELFDVTGLFEKLSKDPHTSLDAEIFFENLMEPILDHEDNFKEGTLDYFLNFDQIKDPKVIMHLGEIENDRFSSLAKAYIKFSYIWGMANHLTHMRKTKNLPFFHHLLLATEILSEFNTSFISQASELWHDITEERISDEGPDELIFSEKYQLKKEAIHRLNLIMGLDWINKRKIPEPYKEVMKHYLAVQHDLLSVLTHDKRMDYMGYMENIVNPTFIRPSLRYDQGSDKALEILQRLTIAKNIDMAKMSKELHEILRGYGRDPDTIEANKRKLIAMKLSDMGANGMDLPLKRSEKSIAHFTASQILYHCVKSSLFLTRTLASYYSGDYRNHETWSNRVFNMMKKNVEIYLKPTNQAIHYLRSKLDQNYCDQTEQLFETYIEHGDIHKINLRKYVAKRKRGRKSKIEKAKEIFNGTIIDYIAMICKYKEKKKEELDYKKLFGVALVTKYFYEMTSQSLEEIQESGKISKEGKDFMDILNPEVQDKIREKMEYDRREMF